MGSHSLYWGRRHPRPAKTVPKLRPQMDHTPPGPAPLRPHPPKPRPHRTTPFQAPPLRLGGGWRLQGGLRCSPGCCCCCCRRGRRGTATAGPPRTPPRPPSRSRAPCAAGCGTQPPAAPGRKAPAAAGGGVPGAPLLAPGFAWGPGGCTAAGGGARVLLEGCGFWGTQGGCPGGRRAQGSPRRTGPAAAAGGARTGPGPPRGWHR